MSRTAQQPSEMHLISLPLLLHLILLLLMLIHLVCIAAGVLPVDKEASRVDQELVPVAARQAGGEC